MVELVVNLISASAATAGGKLTRTRTIEFGMMVAPSKPQATLGAETARGQWTRANGMPRTDPGTDGGPVGSSAALIGNSGYWGARDGDAGFYPYVVMLTVVPFLDACCHSNCTAYTHCGCIRNGFVSFWIRYEHNFSIWEYFGLLRGGAPATDFLANDYAQMMLRDCVARGNLSTDTACTMPKSDMGEWTFSQNVLTQTHSEANPERNSYVHTPHNTCHSEAFVWLLKLHCFGRWCRTATHSQSCGTKPQRICK